MTAPCTAAPAKMYGYGDVRKGSTLLFITYINALIEPHSAGREIYFNAGNVNFKISELWWKILNYVKNGLTKWPLHYKCKVVLHGM